MKSTSDSLLKSWNTLVELNFKETIAILQKLLKEFAIWSDDIYAEVDGIYECNSNTSKKIHDEFGSDDDHEVNCYIEAEIRSGKQVKLYCKYYLQDWDEEEETYTMCSTGDYYSI